MLAAISLRAGRGAPPLTPLALAVFGYAAWAMANDLFNVPYNAAGVFHPMFLLCAFLLARGWDDRASEQCFAALLAGVAILAAWGLWQAAAGQGRGHAHFETPNTLATVLNLALAPFAVAVALGERRRIALAAGGLLAAGLAATLSRGGFIALAAGLAAAWLLSRRSFTLSGSLRTLALLAAGGALGAVVMVAPHWTGGEGADSGLGEIASTLGGSLGSRAELYRLAASVAVEHPWAGIGYLGFHDLLEKRRLQVPSYGTVNTTYFAHNDYLQTFVELGAPGALLLLAIVVLPFMHAALRSSEKQPPRALLCALAALATMAVHALGDFPFYVPLCLLLFGLALGVADRILAGESLTARWRAPRARYAAIALALAFAYLLILPPAAEASAAYGDRQWHRGDGVHAAFGFELARRLQPRDWRYHWYAGQFWLAQARQGNRAAAPLADRAFAAAMEANPAEPRPILGRLAIQLDFSPFLEQPQSGGTLRGWAEHALALAPLNPAVQRDHAAALEKLSRAR